MKLTRLTLLKWLLICSLHWFVESSIDGYSDSSDKQQHYTNTWAVEVSGGPRVARDVAESKGFHFHGPLGTLTDYYIFEHKDVNKRSRRSADDHHSNLLNHESVVNAEQQKILSRKKRGYIKDPLFPLQWYLVNSGQLVFVCLNFVLSIFYQDLSIQAWLPYLFTTR